MNKKTYEIVFYEDKAYINDKLISKQELIQLLSSERGKSKLNNSKKVTNNLCFSYIFENDESIIKFSISKKHENLNKELINELERLYEIDRKKKLKKLKLISSMISLGFVLGFISSEPIKNLKLKEHLQIAELDREIKLHGMDENHKCLLGDKEMYYEIMKYISESDLPIEIALESIKKYNYYLNDDIVSAENIDLHKIYKKEQKSK